MISQAVSSVRTDGKGVKWSEYNREHGSLEGAVIRQGSVEEAKFISDLEI